MTTKAAVSTNDVSENAKAATTEDDGETTTSTITSIVTITDANGNTEVLTEVAAETSGAEDASYCVPTTVTVTVTAEQTSEVVSTIVHTTQVPLTAEFTLDDTTTTLTSWVDLTSTDLVTITSTSSVYDSYSTGASQSHPISSYPTTQFRTMPHQSVLTTLCKELDMKVCDSDTTTAATTTPLE